MSSRAKGRSGWSGRPRFGSATFGCRPTTAFLRPTHSKTRPRPRPRRRYGYRRRSAGPRTPPWPVPKHGGRGRDPVGELGRSARPDVQPQPAGRPIPAPLANLPGRLPAGPEAAVRGKPGDVAWDNDLLIPGQQLPAPLDLVGFEQRGTHRVTLGGQEREAHAAPHDEEINSIQVGFDDAQLVAHLGAAQHRDERPGRPVKQPIEDLDLVGQHPAGGARQPRRRPRDGGVGAVSGPRRRSRTGPGPRPDDRRRRGHSPPRRGRSEGCPTARRRAPAGPHTGGSAPSSTGGQACSWAGPGDCMPSPGRHGRPAIGWRAGWPGCGGRRRCAHR